MPPHDGFDGQDFDPVAVALARSRETVETMLFESLVHHLIEKGVFTKNDALSVVQTVAQVKGGQAQENGKDWTNDRDLAFLKRLYASFELLNERRPGRVVDGENVLPLRPPLHGNKPEFPHDDY